VRHKIGHIEETREIDNNFCLYNFFVIDDSIRILFDRYIGNTYIGIKQYKIIITFILNELRISKYI